MNIVLCYPVEDRHVAAIAAAAPDATIINAGQEGIADYLGEADIFCGHAKVPVPWPEVVRQGRLRWIQSSAAGLDHCLVPEVVAAETIQVTSASGLFADGVAEQTMALLLGLLRSMPTFYGAQLRHEFIRRPTRDLHGTTVGIVGLGGNGRRIAEVLAPWRVKTVAVDLHPVNQPASVDTLWHASRLDELLAISDIVILCVPLTEHTTRMIDAARLAQMRPGSLLINVARGAVVVEGDLVSALRSGHLAGAGLDVTESEPLDPESPLWDLPGVAITPHVGAQSADRVDKTTRFFCDNLQRFFTKVPMRNLVDKRLGYPVPSGAEASDD